jgi:hypothetical protein
MARGAAGRRWKLDHAIEQSGMEPMTRHLLHTLLRNAEPKTGLIPDEHQSSMAALRQRTGMRLETLQDAIKDAERRGWLLHKRGGGRRPGSTNRYVVKRPDETAQELADSYPDAGYLSSLAEPMNVTRKVTRKKRADQAKPSAQISGSDQPLNTGPRDCAPDQWSSASRDQRSGPLSRAQPPVERDDYGIVEDVVGLLSDDEDRTALGMLGAEEHRLTVINTIKARRRREADRVWYAGCIEGGMTADEIAAQAGISVEALRRDLRALGLPEPKPPGDSWLDDDPGPPPF